MQQGRERPSQTAQNAEDQLGWFALTLTRGLGPRRILAVAKQLSTPSQVFELSLLEALPLSAKAAQLLFDGKGPRWPNRVGRARGRGCASGCAASAGGERFGVISIAVLVVEKEISGTPITARCAAEQNRDLFAVPGQVTGKNTWTSNTLIKQGARLVETGEDVWEERPSNVRLELAAEVGAASKPGARASFLPDPALRPEEAMVLEVLCSDQWLEIDGIPESLETQLISSEVFTALFELKMAGRMSQLPGEK